MSESHIPEHEPTKIRGRVICTCTDFHCASLDALTPEQIAALPEKGMVLLDEDRFWLQYSPMAAPDGGVIFEFEEVRYADVHHVWTVLDSPCGPGVTAIPGIHTGGFGYCVTAAKWPHEYIEAAWFDPREA